MAATQLYLQNRGEADRGSGERTGPFEREGAWGSLLQKDQFRTVAEVPASRAFSRL